MATKKAELADAFVIAPSVYSRPFGEETVLLDFGKGNYFGLDPVGSVLWTTLAAGGTIGEAVGRIVDAFEAPGPSAVERDLLQFTDELLANGLIIPR